MPSLKSLAERKEKTVEEEYNLYGQIWADGDDEEDEEDEVEEEVKRALARMTVKTPQHNWLTEMKKKKKKF